MAYNPELFYIPDHGTTSIIGATNTSDCVDPRLLELAPDFGTIVFKRTPDHGAEKSPGATAGKIMALMLAVPRLDPISATQLVIRWEASEIRHPTIHTDNSGHQIGCGHIAKAASGDYEDLYGIPASKVDDMMGEITRLGEHGLFVVNSLLTGPHKEEGVLIVKSTKRTVLPYVDNRPFFRFDQTRHDARLESLARYAQGVENVVVTGKQLRAAAKRQRNATLGLIAGGLPIYTVTFRKGYNTAIFSGRVPRRN